MVSVSLVIMLRIGLPWMSYNVTEYSSPYPVLILILILSSVLAGLGKISTLYPDCDLMFYLQKG